MDSNKQFLDLFCLCIPPSPSEHVPISEHSKSSCKSLTGVSGGGGGVANNMQPLSWARTNGKNVLFLQNSV